MDIHTLLSGWDCDCGRRHESLVKGVFIEAGAISRLGGLMKPYSSVLLIADSNTFAAAGDLALSSLDKAGVKYKLLVFSGDTLLVPDEDTVASVEEMLSGADCIVAVGSGVLQDTAKFVSHKHGVPYSVVATAPSMDGYASSGAAMIAGGMKVTYSAALPEYILGDTRVLAEAPVDMIKAGYGDILGKYSALCDWRLANLVYGEYFCSAVYGAVYGITEACMKDAELLLSRDENAVGRLMEALVAVGLCMSYVGSSRPASGSEHHLGHFFEITGLEHGAPYLTHGIDVAYSTVVTAKIREYLARTEVPDAPMHEPREEYEANMRSAYGKVADGCFELQEKTGRYREDRLRIYCEKQADLKKLLSECPTADEITEHLEKIGLKYSDFVGYYGEDKIKTAVRYAKDLKDRYTVLWMLYDYGIEVY